MTDAPHQRRIRSFVRRAGRQTRAQDRALRELWPRFGLPEPGEGPAPRIDLEAAFGRSAPTVLEIGFGNGDALVSMAAEAAGINFLGVEVHAPGVGHCLLQIERLGLENVRLVMQDAVDLLRDRLPEGSLAGVHLYFPDPWPKKRHHKRRLVQPEFLALLAGRLAPGGYVHVVTDWPDYALHIRTMFEASTSFESTGGPIAAAKRPRTRFEARGVKLGHPISDSFYLRRS